MEGTILFADMIDSATFSHVHDPHSYDSLVSAFQDSAAKVVKEAIDDAKVSPDHFEAAVRGDELSLIVARVPDPSTGADSDEANKRLAALALQVAVRLKRRWLLVAENVTRIEAGQPPLGIAIGIHAGPVVIGRHLRFTAGSLRTKRSTTAEGYAINLAKRVETASRTGRFSQVFLTRPVYNRTPSDFRQAFIRTDVPQLKGLPAAPTIYEAKSIGHFDDEAFTRGTEFDREENLKIYERIVSANPNELWLLLDLAHRYFDKGNYEDAARMYRAVIEVDEGFAAAHAYLGRACFRDYRPPEAQVSLQRAVELNPAQARANNYLAVCLRRQAVLSLATESLSSAQEEQARDLLRRAVLHHDRARRAAAREDFPWARNGLNWTIAQCAEFERSMSLPYGLERAYADAKRLDDEIKRSPRWHAKRHLTLHTLGFIRLQQKQWHPALQHLKAALAALVKRKRDRDRTPDKKGYAERKSEILFHIGLCQFNESGISPAKTCWRKAKATIEKAWGEDSKRAFDAQYWMNHRVRVEGREIPISTLLSGVAAEGLTPRSRRRRRTRRA